MGLGHVPAGPLCLVRAGRDLQGRQRRGASREGAVTILGAAGAHRRALGASGEDRAAAWYLERGYEVLDRNWRCREGELDLIARLGATLVFCEVKTRSSDGFGAPAEAVSRTKQARIRRLAARWLQDHRSRLDGRPALLRFDVAAILDGRIDVLEGAF